MNKELLRVFFSEAVKVSSLWLLVYGGANWITSLHSFRLRLWSEIELTIPFVPAATIVYLSLFPMLWLAPSVLHTPARLREFSKTLSWLILISGIGFLFLPVLPAEAAYPQHKSFETFHWLFNFADRINLENNLLPSLHVGMAVVCACTYARTSSRLVLILFWLWAAAIAASTLLLHQHYVADVVTGWALALVVAAKCSSSSAAAQSESTAWNQKCLLC